MRSGQEKWSLRRKTRLDALEWCETRSKIRYRQRRQSSRQLVQGHRLNEQKKKIGKWTICFQDQPTWTNFLKIKTKTKEKKWIFFHDQQKNSIEIRRDDDLNKTFEFELINKLNDYLRFKCYIFGNYYNKQIAKSCGQKPSSRNYGFHTFRRLVKNWNFY